MALIAKGTRRPKAKLAAHLEPYSAVDLMVAKGRTIDRVTFARAERHGIAFASSWEATSLAAFLAATVDQLTRDGQRDIPFFDFLADAFDHIAIDGLADSRSFATGFVLRCLSLLGYAPQLDHCLDCRRSIATVEGTFAIPDRGGIRCTRCAASAPDGIPCTAADRAQLVHASAAFSCNPCSDAMTSFAIGALGSHVWQPLRTPFPGVMIRHVLTSATAGASMTTS